MLPLLVTSQLDPDADNGYATWYVAAVGTLMTIAAARRQLAVAWVGVIALAVQTVVWAGPVALGGARRDRQHRLGRRSRTCSRAP